VVTCGIAAVAFSAEVANPRMTTALSRLEQSLPRFDDKISDSLLYIMAYDLVRKMRRVIQSKKFVEILWRGQRVV
jgi:hypothetical protein